MAPLLSAAGPSSISEADSSALRAAGAPLTSRRHHAALWMTLTRKRWYAARGSFRPALKTASVAVLIISSMVSEGA